MQQDWKRQAAEKEVQEAQKAVQDAQKNAEQAKLAAEKAVQTEQAAQHKEMEAVKREEHATRLEEAIQKAQQEKEKKRQDLRKTVNGMDHLQDAETMLMKAMADADAVPAVDQAVAQAEHEEMKSDGTVHHQKQPGRGYMPGSPSEAARSWIYA